MKKILYTLLGVALVATVHAQTITVERSDGKMPPPQLGVSPPQIKKSLQLVKGKPLNQSIVFYNYNPKPKHITVKLIDTDDKYQPIEPDKTTLSPWTILNPTTFVIEGNGQQTIRLSVRPPVGFPKKTHYAVLHIQQQVKDSITKNKDGIVLKFGSSYALPVHIQVK